MVIKLDKIVKVGYFLTLPLSKNPFSPEMTKFHNFILWNSEKQIKSTPDSLNLLGKLKKVRVIGSSGQITANEEVSKKNVWGGNATKLD